MSDRSKRILLKLALLAVAPFLLVTAIWCLLFFNSVNPMQLAFVTDFEVENQTQEPIWITPIGSSRSGRRSVLPQFVAPFPAIPTWRSRDLRVGPGDRRRIFYDWDDINFSEIAIRDSAGVLHSLVIDPTPPTDSYYANKVGLYGIINLRTLPCPTPIVAAAVAPSRNRLVFWLFAFAGLVAPFLFFWLGQKLSNLTPGPDASLTESQVCRGLM